MYCKNLVTQRNSFGLCSKEDLHKCVGDSHSFCFSHPFLFPFFKLKKKQGRRNLALLNIEIFSYFLSALFLYTEMYNLLFGGQEYYTKSTCCCCSLTRIKKKSLGFFFIILVCEEGKRGLSLDKTIKGKRRCKFFHLKKKRFWYQPRDEKRKKREWATQKKLGTNTTISKKAK